VNDREAKRDNPQGRGDHPGEEERADEHDCRHAWPPERAPLTSTKRRINERECFIGSRSAPGRDHGERQATSPICHAYSCANVNHSGDSA